MHGSLLLQAGCVWIRTVLEEDASTHFPVKPGRIVQQCTSVKERLRRTLECLGAPPKQLDQTPRPTL